MSSHNLFDRRWPGVRLPFTILLAITGAALIGCSPPTQPAGSPGPSAVITLFAGPTIAPPASLPLNSPVPTPPLPEAPPLPGTPPLPETPTRLVVTSLEIDLPVVMPGENETFPLCDVAEVSPRYSLMGTGGVTYLYAHARVGMFWPLLRESRLNGGQSLIGVEVDVYTDADMLYRYAIIGVYLGVLTFDIADNTTGNYLFLQTSSNRDPAGTKVLIMAEPTGSPMAALHDQANPIAQPRVCT